MNFARDVVDAAPADAPALIELGRDGSRREWAFAEVSRASAGLAGRLREEGVEAGDVVVTLVGNRSEWALALVACFRIGAVVLPCTEQLRAADLQARLETVRPRVVIADERNLGELDRTDARERAAVIVIPDPSIYAADPAPAVELDPDKRNQLFIQMNDLAVNDVVEIALIARTGASGKAKSLKWSPNSSWDSNLWDTANWSRAQ